MKLGIVFKSREIPHGQNKVLSFDDTSSRSKLSADSERFYIVKELHMISVYHFYPPLQILFQSSFKDFLLSV